jgi:6-phosphogluconolactonase
MIHPLKAYSRDEFRFHGKGLLMPTKGLSRLAIAFVLATILLGCNSNNNSSHTAYVTLPTLNRVLTYRINDKTGALTSTFGGSFVAGASPTAAAVHPTNRFLYVVNAAENDISLFNIDSTSGVLREVLPRTRTSAVPIALAIDPAGSFLYVVNQGVNGVSSYSIDSSKGTLTQIAGSPVAAGLNPASIVVTPSGKYVYVTDTNSNSLSAYTVNAGALQPIAGSPFVLGNGPLAIAVDPAEKFVYVTNTVDSTLSVLSIDPTTGAVANIVGSPFDVVQINNTGADTGPVSIAIHPSGALLYIANEVTGDLTFYSIDSSGVPTELTNSPFTSGRGTNFVVIDRTGNFLFVGDQANKDLSVYGINTTTGALVLNSLVSTGVGATQMVLSK